MKHANGLLRVMHAALMPGPMYGPEGIRVAPRRAAKAGGLPWQAAVAGRRGCGSMALCSPCGCSVNFVLRFDCMHAILFCFFSYVNIMFNKK